MENSSGEQDTLYLFGRTATEPYTYYYRECINPEANKPTWTAWQKIDLTINSEYINATYAFNKLFIFWVEVVQIKSKEKPDSSAPKSETKATIKYSFQKFGKQWIQPQTLAKDIVIEDYDSNTDGNLWRKVNALPIPGNGSEPEKILTLFGNLKKDALGFHTLAPATTLTIDLLQENKNVLLQNQPSNAFRSRLPVISNNQLKAIATNNFLYDNYADYADDISISRGAVGYWPMNEGSGKVIGDRTGNHNGTLEGDAQWKEVTDFPDADSRNVLEFDGDKNYIDCGNIDFARNEYTVAAWFKTSSPSAGDIFAATRSNKHGILIEVSSNGTLRYLHRQPVRIKDGTNLSTEEKYNDGKWHHVVAVKNSTQMSLYVDGSLKGEASAPSNFSESLDVVIGKISKETEGRFFKGQIAEVSISIPLIPIPLIQTNISKPHVSVSTIKNQPGWFTFDNGDEAFLAIPQKEQKAKVFKQIDNNLRAVAEDGMLKLSYDEYPSDISSLSELDFTFTRLTTTTIRQLSQKMFIGGLDRLLTLDSQLTPELNFNRFSPSDFVIPPNTRQLDFDGPFGIYFWEIFFHIPFLIANTLNSNQRFEEAQKWYHYIFNPTVQLQDNKKGLVGYWPMNEVSENEAGEKVVIPDRAGNNDGTLKGNAKLETVNDFPGYGSRKVLDLDGSADYVEIQAHSNPTGQITVAVWAKSNTEHWNSSGCLVSKREAYILHPNENSKTLCFYILEENEPVCFTPNIDLTQWHYYAGTFDGRTIRLYIDGNEVAAKYLNADNVSINEDSGPLLIGKDDFAEPRYFNGQIAEVRIWNVALSSEQILDEVSRHPSDRFWRYLPFRGNSLQKLQDILTNDDAIAAYNDNPFDPHAIARLRIGAYEKAIVMKYIDNLLDWGDQLFAQDNRESISQATLLYLLAYDLLGDKPENLGKRRSPDPKTFQQIKEQYQSAENIPQFLIELENRVSDTTPIASAPINELNTYFCAPENEQFIAYWERVEDRLYKIRYCLSIEGVRRQLALFQAPIEPAQLVRAVAGGTMPLSVVSQLTPAVPNYRFDYMLDRAKNITSTLIQLGSSLLSALEKKDAEELALLRSSHEQSILKLITTTKEKQIEEAEETLASLKESQNSAEKRHTYYTKLIQKGLSTWEITHLVAMTVAQRFNIAAGISRTAASIGYAVPQVGSPFSMNYGGKQLGAVLTALAGAAEIGSSTSTFIAQLSQTMGGYERRQQEWELQRDLSEIDIKQIKHQIEAQKIRQTIAEQDLKTHNKSIEQAKEIEDFLKGKFTNQELYQWMIGRLSILYFQTYKIALDMAVATQKAYQYELNKDDTYINFDYWDSLKKGLLAGESLMLGLNQLEKAYIEGNVRRLEIEKTISLLQLDPEAFLSLKDTGKCEFELSEKLFDLDFPGHYCRQIKTISISIPAVVGPYQNIKASLTQLSDKTLIKADKDAVNYLLKPEPDKQPDTSKLRSSWRRNQKIALSKGVNDTGLFELNFRDERYLPFEGTGAVSTWDLSLPKAANRINFETISDVIITLSYTALDGGNEFRKKVTSLEKLKHYSEAYYFNLKQAFPGEWQTFINSNTDTNSQQQFSFNISSEIIPPHIEDAKLTGIIFKLDAHDVSSNQSFITLEIANGQPIEINLQDKNIADVKKLSNEQFAGNWVINFDLNKVPDSLKKGEFLNSEIVNNIELILTYEGEINWENDPLP